MARRVFVAEEMHCNAATSEGPSVKPRADQLSGDKCVNDWCHSSLLEQQQQKKKEKKKEK